MQNSHWCKGYIGKPWTEKMDCLGWFRYWSLQYFGIDICDYDINHMRLTSSAARAMEDAADIFGYVKTSTPKEGDAVYMSQRARAHHLGMYVVMKSGPHVLHALENVGVILSDQLDLAANGWHVKEYRTYAR